MKRVTVTVDPDDYDVFDSLAKNSDVTASWLIRRSMREFLERYGKTNTLSMTLGEMKQTR
ncbi:MAG: CopG family transcriptional regulator [Hyphomicrobiaceae bacterium]|nr:CopG family transcriptional regulator [Hyphomicrobiaceae bacterium]MCC0009771.1 CopG family transcriptional regulator [Hyphomicrobiaceae bacterium]